MTRKQKEAVTEQNSFPAPDTAKKNSGQFAKTTKEDAIPGNLDELKSKLRKKFHLLKDDKLHQDTLEALKEHVGTVLGMSRPDLDWMWNDL